MSGFIANSNTMVEIEQIVNNGFFPDIDLCHFRAVMAVENRVTSEQMRQAIIDAMLPINSELKSWQENSQVQYLADVPSEHYGDQTRLEHLYRAALFNRARGLLLERYCIESVQSDHDRIGKMDNPANECFRRSRQALRSLLGTPRITVELI